MGYIIINEEKLKERISLQKEEARIDEDIRNLQLKKGDIAVLMKYVK